MCIQREANDFSLFFYFTCQRIIKFSSQYYCRNYRGGKKLRLAENINEREEYPVMAIKQTKRVVKMSGRFIAVMDKKHRTLGLPMPNIDPLG